MPAALGQHMLRGTPRAWPARPQRLPRLLRLDETISGENTSGKQLPGHARRVISVSSSGSWTAEEAWKVQEKHAVCPRRDLGRASGAPPRTFGDVPPGWPLDLQLAFVPSSDPRETRRVPQLPTICPCPPRRGLPLGSYGNEGGGRASLALDGEVGVQGVRDFPRSNERPGICLPGTPTPLAWEEFSEKTPCFGASRPLSY